MLTEAVAQSDVGTIPETIRVDDAWLPTWPDSQEMRVLGDSRIVITRFADIDHYHGPLLAAAMAGLDDPRFRDADSAVSPWACGRKVRNLAQWNAPAAALVHARAIAFAHRVTGHGPVYAADTWASVYYEGDYCMPHSHVYSDVSLVYTLDAGDSDPSDPASGRLTFLDPRIDWCCPHEPGRATRPLIPDLPPGSMVAFVSECLHSVNPYRGRRPRVTLSWNMTKARLSGPTRIDLASLT